MGHYFENDPDLKSDPVLINFAYRGTELSFLTDAGVFSKGRVDFGSFLLLNSLPEDLDGKRILDLGCGYGAIGLAVAKVYADAQVEMTDVNRRALSLARENASANGIGNVRIYESDLFKNIASEFDLILSNPPIRAGKDIVHGIADGGYRHLRSGGELWMVIRKKQGAPSLFGKLEDVFSVVETVNRAKGYHVLRAQKS